MKKLFLLTVLIAAVAATSFAQNLSANAAVFAVVQSSGSATGTSGIGYLQDMNFGSIDVSGITTGNTGTVTINPETLGTAANLTATPSYKNAAVGSNPGTIQPAAFTITGLPSAINITSGATLKSGSNTLLLSDIKSNKANVLAAGAAGTKTLYVGGTLTLNPNQPVGGYSSYGEIVVTIIY
ncbi:MAG: DUF4402 domain-containing protein [Bacteroidota bacterium]|nr:DUF4402 domain-containing protein [Bacteroidota bacterium]